MVCGSASKDTPRASESRKGRTSSLYVMTVRLILLVSTHVTKSSFDLVTR